MVYMIIRTALMAALASGEITEEEARLANAHITLEEALKC
jgi:hypothetical protein